MSRKNSFVLTLSNNVTEKEGVNYLIEKYTGFFKIDLATKKELLDLEPETKEDKDEIRKLKSKYLPYKEDVTEKTLLELKKVSTLDGEIPKKLIEAILGETEKNIIKKMRSSQDGGFNQDLIRKN
jgi:hypothetical protein